MRMNSILTETSATVLTEGTAVTRTPIGARVEVMKVDPLDGTLKLDIHQQWVCAGGLRQLAELFTDMAAALGPYRSQG